MSRASRCLATVAIAAGLTAVTASPAYALCTGVRADTPTLSTASNGQIVVTGYGGARFCAGSISVCLEHNAVTVASLTCRYYTGTSPEGPTGSTPCRLGVWRTWVVVTPSDNSSPHTVHGDPLVVTPSNCPVAVVA